MITSYFGLKMMKLVEDQTVAPFLGLKRLVRIESLQLVFRVKEEPSASRIEDTIVSSIKGLLCFSD